MTNEIERAYASNEDTPILTVEFLHSALTGGALRLARSHVDINAALEDTNYVVFSAAGIDISLPKKSTDGRQDVSIAIDNTSNQAWQEINKVISANRSGASEAVRCKVRPYLMSDLSAPASAAYILTVNSSSIDRKQANISAGYTPLPDSSFPRKRYYPKDYLGVRYV